MCSWAELVSHEVGWLGVALAGSAYVGSLVLPPWAGVKADDQVMLDSRLLKARGEGYLNAIERFRNGSTLVYDGVGFAFRGESEIACGILADQGDLTEVKARELADHAQASFDQLRSTSPEFATAVAGYKFRISIVQGTRELCRVVDGQLVWFK